jgi:beta-galactosidase
VRVFTNADAVELHLNDQLVGRQASGAAHAPLVFDTGGYAPGDLVATAYIGGRVVAQHRVRTPGASVRLVLAWDDLGVPATPGDLVFARARLVDANGTTVPVSGREVTFSGGAAIVGSASVTTEAGIASVLVRAGTGQPVLSAQAGLLRGELAVQSRP